MKVLWIHACARENSRTYQLTKSFLDLYTERNAGAEVTEVNLFKETDMTCFDNEKVSQRDQLQKNSEWNHTMFDKANQWLEADKIIISAPYWDLSFPSILKVYFEQIFVTGLTFYYDETGNVRGKSKAEKLLYVVTAGGMVQGEDLGFSYVKACANMLGIEEVQRLAAEGLDIFGSDEKKIMYQACGEAEKIANEW